MAGRSLGVAVLIVLVAVVSVFGAAGHTIAVAPSVPAFAPLSGGPAPLPARGAVWYMQEGATVAANNGLTLIEPSVLTATFTVRSSPYSTGYELNGLSDSGDWYQAIITDNWPGCLPGFGFADEEWNATGFSVGVNCSLTVAIAAGDAVSLQIELNCAGLGPGSYCMTVTDVTRGTSATITGSQPDPAGTRFVNLDTPANRNGYFTGPMTEVIDTAASGCLAYTSLPQIDYVIGNGSVAPSAYIPWSDEFGLTNSGTISCYQHFDAITTVPATPVSLYLEATGGSAYGPHWEAGQDWSAVPGASGGWRFQTDVSPLSLSLSLQPTSVDVGQNATATGTPSGGQTPYRCEWTVAGTALTTTACTTIVPAWSPGPEIVHAYVVDGDRDYAEAQGTLTVISLLSVSLVTNPTAVTLGQTYTIQASVSGGHGPFNATWQGLPLGCAAPPSAAPGNVTCTAAAPGRFVVNVSVTDANHNVAAGSVLVVVTLTPMTPPPTGSGPSANALEATAILLIILVVVVVALLLARRGRQPPPMMPPPVQWPPPPPPPPQPPGPPPGP